jgi:hypothetical protein
MASDDGTHVYFTGTGVLAPGAVSGQRNLYVWTQAAGVRLVGTGAFTNARFARVTRDGKYALITSTDSLGGAPNGGRNAVYLYDDSAGTTTCISCHPDGSTSSGDAYLGEESLSPSAIPLANAPSTAQRVRNFTDDGRVFFESEDPLLPADRNHVLDVYEYDHGTLKLISGGRGDEPSYVADNTPDGRSVFFITRDSLVPQDIDHGLGDLYVARVGGGFPEPPPASPGCSGDDCQGALPPAPPPTVPGSTRDSGAGNEPVRPGPLVPSLAVSAVGRTARAALAKTGHTTLSVRVTGGGALRLKATARVRGHRRTVASASRTLPSVAATTVKIPLRLSSAARGELRRNGRLLVGVDVRATSSADPQTLTLTLTRAR